MCHANTSVLCWSFLRYNCPVDGHQNIFISPILHEHSSIPPSTADHDPSTTIFGYLSTSPMLHKHFSIPPSTANHDPCTTIFGYLSTSPMPHKQSSIPPSTANHDPCSIIFGYLSTSPMPHKQSSIPPSTANHDPCTTIFGFINFTHAPQTFFHPSIDSQSWPMYYHLWLYQLHPCPTNSLPPLHRQLIMTHVPPPLAKLIPPHATGSPSSNFSVHFTV